MDRVGEATLQLGKRGDEFASAAILTASGNGRLHERKTEAKRSVDGVRAVRGGGRKDRHTKVFTARGTRDRRVRLSPKTAILFYDVQERLGCDRPSKAIDWLMKEAKVAIDDLDDRPPAPAPATNSAESKYDDTVDPISGLDFFSGGAAPPPEELQASVGIPTPLELFDVDSEIVRLQRFFSWNYADCVSSAPLHYPAPAPAEFHLFAEREPLQSSHQFQGLEFRDQELQTFKEAEINSSFEQVSFLPTL